MCNQDVNCSYSYLYYLKDDNLICINCKIRIPIFINNILVENYKRNIVPTDYSGNDTYSVTSNVNFHKIIKSLTSSGNLFKDLIIL